MNTSPLTEWEARCEVQALFDRETARKGDYCWWPIVGGGYIYGEDPIDEVFELLVRALLARDWFTRNGPPDAAPLPISYDEREAMKNGSLSHIVAWYARSLAHLNYDVEQHPSFEDYAAGVLYAAEKGEFLRDWNPATVDELKKRFPPRELKELESGLYWKPPAERRGAKARRTA